MGYVQIPVAPGSRIKASQVAEMQAAVMDRISHVSPSTPGSVQGPTIRRYIALPAGGEDPISRVTSGQHLRLVVDTFAPDAVSGLRMCVGNLFGIGLSGNHLDLRDVVQYGLPTTADRAAPAPWLSDPADWPDYYYHNPEWPYTVSNNQWLMEYVYDTRDRKTWIRKPARAGSLAESDYLQSGTRTYSDHLNEVQTVVQTMTWMLVAHDYDAPERLWGNTAGPWRGYHGDRWFSHELQRFGVGNGDFPPSGAAKIISSGISANYSGQSADCNDPVQALQEYFRDYRQLLVGSLELSGGVSVGATVRAIAFIGKSIVNNLGLAGKNGPFNLRVSLLMNKFASYDAYKTICEDDLFGAEAAPEAMDLWSELTAGPNVALVTASTNDLPGYKRNLAADQSDFDVSGSAGIQMLGLLSDDEVDDVYPVENIATEGAGYVNLLCLKGEINVLSQVTSFSY
ncbi:MAG: hypothetical protein LLG93_07615 [Deltaproteobacteria bacterium]|nr:hypothetical protein [Deltaproteobacteria bacterium]